MLTQNSPRTTWDIVLPDEIATERLALDIALTLEPGDLVTLSGYLGAGKTTLARAIIRALAQDPRFEVPSPTFTLLQIYDLPRFPVVHADLYRVKTLAELAELGWEEAAEGAAVLVEWPERASAFIHADRLDILLELARDLGPNARHVRLTGYGVWAARLMRFRATRELIDTAGFGNATRQLIPSDASSRSYERLHSHPGAAILMSSPPRPDGSPIKNGKPYSVIAHLAEDVRPFVALTRALRERGFSAPEIFAADIENGLLVLEDLGTEGIVAGDPPVPIEERYTAAIDVLVALHNMALPDVLPVFPRIEHRIPPYDLDAFLIELELMLDWYLPYRGVTSFAVPLREDFTSLWRAALTDVIASPPTWVLRDFHSPNLLWLPEREEIARVGLLDFQDTVMGPTAYDVASILMDARVDVPPELEIKLLLRYAIGRGRVFTDFDPDEFARQYVTLGAQRATKILGIFARLAKRDGKSQYLVHLPRVWNYLMRSLAHPSLTKIKSWYEANVPPPGDGQIPAGKIRQPSIDAQRSIVPNAAMLLAAGIGARMRPLTDTKPKPLVEVMGRALIDHNLDRLAAAGVSKVVVNVHHFADQIETHLASRQNPKIIFSDERRQLLDTGGGIVNSLSVLGNEPFVLLNADSLWLEDGASNIVALAHKFNPKQMDALLLLAPVSNAVGYEGRGDYFLNIDGRLRHREIQETAPYVYAGGAILSPTLFKDAPAGVFSLAILFDRAQAAGRLFGLELNGLFLHVGTPEAIIVAEEAIRRAKS